MGQNYSFVCRATADVILNTPPAATWLSPDGSDLQATFTQGITVSYVQQGYTTIVSLNFHPLGLRNAGDYECVSSLQETGFLGTNRQSTLLTVQGMTTR